MSSVMYKNMICVVRFHGGHLPITDVIFSCIRILPDTTETLGLTFF